MQYQNKQATTTPYHDKKDQEEQLKNHYTASYDIEAETGKSIVILKSIYTQFELADGNKWQTIQKEQFNVPTLKAKENRI